ncbi:MAG: hypothetical protein ABIH34_01600, partial [Nanoarchaeota archaeon]
MRPVYYLLAAVPLLMGAEFRKDIIYQETIVPDPGQSILEVADEMILGPRKAHEDGYTVKYIARKLQLDSGLVPDSTNDADDDSFIDDVGGKTLRYIKLLHQPSEGYLLELSPDIAPGQMLYIPNELSYYGKGWTFKGIEAESLELFKQVPLNDWIKITYARTPTSLEDVGNLMWMDEVFTESCPPDYPKEYIITEGMSLELTVLIGKDFLSTKGASCEGLYATL